MAGSWREILESAAANRGDDQESVCPGEAQGDAESPGFDEPELAAFLTRLASPPDAVCAPQQKAAQRPLRNGKPPAGNGRQAIRWW